MTENFDNKEDKNFERKTAMVFDKSSFAKLVMNDLSSSSNGRAYLKNYKQSEVREIIENYKTEANQVKLRDISRTLWAKSPQYQRLLEYFSGMAIFSYVVTPIKDIRSLNKAKVLKQYTEIGELLRMMNIKHEMKKVLEIAFKEDVFYGYIHKDSKSFHIQEMDSSICKISSIESGVFNYSINMSAYLKDERLLIGLPNEIQVKYRQWKALYNTNRKISVWVELDAENTICIKVNDEVREIFPPFAGSFDAIFDIEGFKRLRKDKEELGNYMIITQKLPIRTDTENNNDFLIDENMFKYFHNMASDTVPDNVGVITSPMEIESVKFDQDRADRDGVAKAERDYWSSTGASQLLFNADKSTSQGLLLSVKTDEEIVFGVLTQIETWINRYLGFKFKDLMFNSTILPVTRINQEAMVKMYLESASYGVPVKSHLNASIGLQPIETMNMAYLENDLLKMHEEFIPLMNSHTMSGDEAIQAKGADGRPKKDASKVSDEGSRSQDKPNA